ncbi:DUF1516 family protein [Acetilactobacillus jinshanensis]|uniref:DUF1516 family protein n=1 Tax=Acetilactobacillus jinshanensis TaxID=1720083 RepID=A0A4P6ZKC9_9LACO|nr:DUF1516 family protein [Acetilactobacillus jinshanensis]QBP18134.1 DUF1516 family protein [Acetilactobacillus jinshanensis]URL60998.1 DUF1516 family protein [uncultured bacterium]
MLLWLHILFVILLLTFLYIDLRKRGGSKFATIMIRILYILFILDGAILLPTAMGRHPRLSFVKVGASLCMIGFLEFLIARRAKNTLTKPIVIICIILLLILIGLGLLTAGFRPWIHL